MLYFFITYFIEKYYYYYYYYIKNKKIKIKLNFIYNQGRKRNDKAIPKPAPNSF